MSSQIAELAQIHRAEDAEGDPRRWLALPVLLTGAFLPILDFNVVNLALPAIRQDLDATSSEVQFVISAYAATYAVFLITGGRLGDLFGRRRLFLLGVAGFTIASVLCGIAWSPAFLVAARILQGLTATAMAPQVLASIRVLFPAEEQGELLASMAPPSAWPTSAARWSAAPWFHRILSGWPGRRSSSSTCRSTSPRSSVACSFSATRVRSRPKGSTLAALSCCP